MTDQVPNPERLAHYHCYCNSSRMLFEWARVIPHTSKLRGYFLAFWFIIFLLYILYGVDSAPLSDCASATIYSSNAGKW